MDANAWISNIKFKNGFNLALKENAIVVFVGPNNAGKSRTLQEIFSTGINNGQSQNNQIIEEVVISTIGKGDDFLKRIEGRRKGINYHFQRSANDFGSLTGEQLNASWEGFSKGTNFSYAQTIPYFLIKQMDTIQRLQLVNPPETIDFMTTFPKHPIHVLKEDGSKEYQFSTHFKLAFGEDVIVNHAAGKHIPLHVGKRPIVTAENDRVSTVYQQQLRALPQLHQQGDGMKSFAGVFLGLFAEDYPINIVDEPEAFLHPPQAALLGRMIAKDLGQQKQVFIATHSEHFLKGLLDIAANRLVIVRIQRENTTNKINVLENAEIQNIWKDSLLRHSNILDGLFHKKVVLSESDSDSRFYSAMSETLIENKSLQSPDILFVQSGGKHRFPVVIRALRKLEVPLTLIGDFDLYHEENPLKAMYEELDGNWTEIKGDFMIVKRAIDQKKTELQTAKLKEELDKIFSETTEEIIPDAKIKLIQAALKKASPWSQAKSSGKSYLPAGDATNSFNNVQTKLKQKGIHILEIGEIEAFDKTVGGHGPKWVN